MTPKLGACTSLFLLLLFIATTTAYNEDDTLAIQDEYITDLSSNTYQSSNNDLNTLNQDIYSQYTDYNNDYDLNTFDDSEMDDRIRKRMIRGYLKLGRRKHRRRGRRGRLKRRRRKKRHRRRKGHRGRRGRKRRRRKRRKRRRRKRSRRRRRNRAKMRRMRKRYKKFMRFNGKYKDWYTTYFGKWYRQNFKRRQRGKGKSGIGKRLRQAIRSMKQSDVGRMLRIPRGVYKGPKVERVVKKMAGDVQRIRRKRRKAKKARKKAKKRAKKGKKKNALFAREELENEYSEYGEYDGYEGYESMDGEYEEGYEDYDSEYEDGYDSEGEYEDYDSEAYDEDYGDYGDLDLDLDFDDIDWDNVLAKDSEIGEK